MFAFTGDSGVHRDTGRKYTLNDGDIDRKYGPVALILGGSEGIGRQFAEQLAARGLALVLVARSAGALDRAASELRATHAVAVTTYAQDLAAPDLGPCSSDDCWRNTTSGWSCATRAHTHGGRGVPRRAAREGAEPGAAELPDPGEDRAPAAERMRRGRGAGLIIVSSMSGVCGSGLVATYAAAKAFEIALCEGLHWELAGQGIDVLCAVAGLTDTPAMRRAGVSFAAAAAAGYVAMDAADVARGALAQLGSTAVWYAVGQATVDAMRAVPRAQLTEAMSAGSAALFQVPAR